MTVNEKLLLAKRREDGILEGAVSLHGSFELIKGDFSITIGVHQVKDLIQFSRFCNISWKTIIRQSLLKGISVRFVLKVMTKVIKLDDSYKY